VESVMVLKIMLVCSLLTELRVQHKMERNACEYFQSQHVGNGKFLGDFIFSFSFPCDS
jgi:hypothetical protein